MVANNTFNYTFDYCILLALPMMLMIIIMILIMITMMIMIMLIMVMMIIMMVMVEVMTVSHGWVMGMHLILGDGQTFKRGDVKMGGVKYKEGIRPLCPLCFIPRTLLPQ